MAARTETNSRGDWFGGWIGTLGVSAGIALGAPVVLGLLVFAAERFGSTSGGENVDVGAASADDADPDE